MSHFVNLGIFQKFWGHFIDKTVVIHTQNKQGVTANFCQLQLPLEKLAQLALQLAVQTGQMRGQGGGSVLTASTGALRPGWAGGSWLAHVLQLITKTQHKTVIPSHSDDNFS